MTLSERIKAIRKDKKLNQADFGKMLGVSRDVINNIEHDRADVKEYMIKHICNTYNVNYLWLTEESGEMYEFSPTIILDELAEEYKLDELDKKIVLEYIKLSEDERNVLKKFILKIKKEG